MTTTVVSGRVDSRVKERAGAHIKAAGLTSAAVIESLWNHIAETGEVPIFEGKNKLADEDPLASFLELRRAMSCAPKWLADLTDEQMNDMMASRYA